MKKDGLINSWLNFYRFKKLVNRKSQITFFSEGVSYQKYLLPLIMELIKRYDCRLTYITLDKKEFEQLADHDHLDVFLVSSKSALIALFETLDVRVMVMTMPDLDNLHLRRSTNSVHYIYIFHSIVRTHMIYRKAAFDNYDTIFILIISFFFLLVTTKFSYDSKLNYFYQF